MNGTASRVLMTTLLATSLLAATPVSAKERLTLSDGHAIFSPAVRDWKSMRDDRVVKQDLDYSCGAASLTTLLNEFYGQAVTEQELMEAMDNGDMRASFADMQRALPKFGFRANGYAATYEQLAKLKIPVVVYVKQNGEDHFSVLRGINENTVLLADPSLGNRTLSKAQFLKIWETRDASQEDGHLKGKFLAVLPEKGQKAEGPPFFTKNPRRQTAAAMELLSIRPF